MRSSAIVPCEGRLIQIEVLIHLFVFVYLLKNIVICTYLWNFFCCVHYDHVDIVIFVYIVYVY